MINKSSLPALLAQIHSALQPTPLPCSHPPSFLQIFQQNFFNCPDDYYGEVQRILLLAKLKITEHLQDMQRTSSDEVLTSDDRNIFLLLKKELAALNGSVEQLLGEGILALYTQLCEIREKCALVGVKAFIEQFVKATIEALSGLLRSFFAYQQYNKHIAPPDQRPRNLLSLRNLADYSTLPHFSLPSLQMMQQIEKTINTKPIHVLIEQHMQLEVVQMKKTREICRICSQKIKLEFIQEHVRSCQKQSLLKQQLNHQMFLINQLLAELQKHCLVLTEKTDRTQLEQKQWMFVKIILCKGKKREKKIVRRCSSIGVDSQKSIKDQTQRQIQNYLDENGENLMLERLLAAYREKAVIERKINSIQITHLTSQNNQTDSNHSSQYDPSLKQLDLRQGKTIKTKKSIFQNETQAEDLIKIDQASEKSVDSHKQIEQNSSPSSFQQLKMFKTKNSFTRHSSSLGTEETPIIKHYVSLQNIFCEQEDSSISLDSFQILKFLGQGAFGKVYMVRRSQTKDIYALKIIRISESYTQKQLEIIKNQHQIFKKIAGDHLVMAPFSFTERQSHMFVLQYLPGGDLRKLLNDQVYFEEDRAKFYLAEIILAIEHLHKFGIIHRDLKPENLVIDKNGHLKLTDFGLSQFKMEEKLENSIKLECDKKNSQRVKKRRTAIMSTRNRAKLIGTPDYIAPEIINRTSINNFTIDWWSLGVMAYQLLIGTRPFCAETIEQVIDNITNFNLEWPEIGSEEGMISPEAQDFIIQLLNKDFTSRLGAKGANELKLHPFFKGIEWNSIKESQPPFLPKMTNVNDLGSLEEDRMLKAEVLGMVGSSDKMSNSKFKLDKFIRFDLLGEETIAKVEKKYQRQTNRLKRLKTIQTLELEVIDDIRPEAA